MKPKTDKGIPSDAQAKQVKKAFHSPSVIVYGDIRSLTTGGTGAELEPGKGTGQPGAKHP
jgi:hypothetical protein